MEGVCRGTRVERARRKERQKRDWATGGGTVRKEGAREGREDFQTLSKEENEEGRKE